MTSGKSANIGWPEETTPQPKAHMGGNQVMGLSNSRMAAPFGDLSRIADRDDALMARIYYLTPVSVNQSLHLRSGAGLLIPSASRQVADHRRLLVREYSTSSAALAAGPSPSQFFLDVNLG